MNYNHIEYDLQQAPAIKLLKADSAALILSFLHKQFKSEQKISVALGELVEQLEEELRRIHGHTPDGYARSAQAYINEWADETHRFIRITAPVPGKNEQPAVELTADTERAIGWIEEMRAETFVGTESRFLLVVQLLQDIVYRSTANPEQRVAQLEEQRDELQRQIDEIRETEKVDDRYTSVQMRERFSQATLMARQLLRDFHLVEDSFRAIARMVQEKQSQPEARKGLLVEYVLDADSELKESDQGKSFYAFWDFLMAPAQHDELYTLLEELRNIPELQGVSRADDVLRRLPKHLLAAGEQVVQSNYRLVEQLRRILDEQAQAESRRVRALTLEIKYMARQLLTTRIEDEAFLEIEGPPEIMMVMERALWQQAETLQVDRQPESANVEDLSTLDFTRLHTQFYVDERVLREHIERMLEFWPEVTLASLLEHYPLEKGLSEVLAYCTIAARSTVHLIDPTEKETVPLAIATEGSEQVRSVVLPKIRYRRRRDEE